jgi:hypothetical protein
MAWDSWRPSVKFKTWLIGPADDPQVEIIGDEEWRQGTNHLKRREERSMMAELFSPQEVKDLQLAPGQWFLPGIPP